jgi:hypothetical protein
VVRDLAVMVADGGECVSDLGGQRDQEALSGPVASDSTAFRTVDRIASTPGLLDALRAAHARARARFWRLDGAPTRLTIDVDATLITARNRRRPATTRAATGFTRCRRTWMRPGKRWVACSDRGTRARTPRRITRAVVDLALAQIPAEYFESLNL